MKKITFNTLPEAISELLERMDKIERALKKRTSTIKTKKATARVGKPRRQETPAGLLSVKDAGKLLKMSLVNLYSYVKNKKIPFQKRGRRLYFSKAELESWNKNRNSQSGLSGDVITIKQAEKLFNVPSSTIYYKIKSQKIAPAVKKGNKLLFSKKELVNAFGKSGRKTKKVSAPKKVTKAAKASKPAKKTIKAAKPSAARPVKQAKTVKSPKSPKAPVVAKAPAAISTTNTKPVKPAKASKKAKSAKPAKPAKPAKTSKPKKVKAQKPEPAPKPESSPVAEKAPEQIAPETKVPQSNSENKE